MRRRVPSGVLAFVALPCMAWAQAGPPMISNDPQTPGAGVWEINLGVAAQAGSNAWETSAPDLDINYGLGERVQLSLHGGWAHARQQGTDRSGWSDTELGVRWRLLDQARIGADVAIQPMWIRGWSTAARRKGLAAETDEWVLPLQVARTFSSGWSGGVEVAKHFVGHAPDQWQASAFVVKQWRPAFTALAEMVMVRQDGQRADWIVNVGARRTLNARLTLMGSVGRQFVTTGEDATIGYLGLQFVR